MTTLDTRDQQIVDYVKAHPGCSYHDACTLGGGGRRVLADHRLARLTRSANWPVWDAGPLRLVGERDDRRVETRS